MDRVSVSCRWITTFPNNIGWRGCLFSIIYFWLLCQKWGGYSCMDSYPGPLFCSTGLYVCFCSRTMLFLLLLLCNIVWSRVLWYYQHCSFCWVLPWLFVVSCVLLYFLCLDKAKQYTIIWPQISNTKSSFLITVLLGYNLMYYEIQSFKVYSLVFFSIFTK
jgi:hypothetical protein